MMSINLLHNTDLLSKKLMEDNVTCHFSDHDSRTKCKE